jgi:hypothetical protein
MQGDVSHKPMKTGTEYHKFCNYLEVYFNIKKKTSYPGASGSHL